MSKSCELKNIIDVFDKEGYVLTQDKRKHPNYDANYFRISDIQWKGANGQMHKIHEEVVYKNDKIGVVLHHNGILRDFESCILKMYPNKFKKDSFFLNGEVHEEGLIFYECEYDNAKPNDVLIAYKNMHEKIRQAVKSCYNYDII